MSFKRLIAALALVVPVLALAASPVMAANHAKKSHHSSVHKASTHKMHKRSAPTTAS